MAALSASVQASSKNFFTNDFIRSVGSGSTPHIRAGILRIGEIMFNSPAVKDELFERIETTIINNKLGLTPEASTSVIGLLESAKVFASTFYTEPEPARPGQIDVAKNNLLNILTEPTSYHEGDSQKKLTKLFRLFGVFVRLQRLQQAVENRGEWLGCGSVGACASCKNHCGQT